MVSTFEHYIFTIYSINFYVLLLISNTHFVFILVYVLVFTIACLLFDYFSEGSSNVVEEVGTKMNREATRKIGSTETTAAR